MFELTGQKEPVGENLQLMLGFTNCVLMPPMFRFTRPAILYPIMPAAIGKEGYFLRQIAEPGCVIQVEIL